MENLSKKPRLIEGGIAVDKRGKISFVNGFNFKGVKRFYIIENASTEIIRAFHGHKKEEKYVLVVTGSALIVAVKIDDFSKPSKDMIPQRFILSSQKPALLHIPGGYANGSRILEKGTKILFFSTASLKESQADDYRFPYDYWGKDIWRTQNK